MIDGQPVDVAAVPSVDSAVDKTAAAKAAAEAAAEAAAVEHASPSHASASSKAADGEASSPDKAGDGGGEHAAVPEAALFPDIIADASWDDGDFLSGLPPAQEVTPTPRPAKKGKKDGAPLTKAGLAQQTGSKKAKKKNCKQCVACSLWHDPMAMATGSRYCHACKNKIDNLSRIAASQSKQEWWKQVRGNDLLLGQVLCEYTKRVSACVAAGRRQSRSATFSQIEAVVTSTALVVESVGKFMTRKQYMHWAESVEGHRCTEAILGM